MVNTKYRLLSAPIPSWKCPSRRPYFLNCLFRCIYLGSWIVDGVRRCWSLPYSYGRPSTLHPSCQSNRCRFPECQSFHRYQFYLPRRGHRYLKISDNHKFQNVLKCSSHAKILIWYITEILLFAYRYLYSRCELECFSPWMDHWDTWIFPLRAHDRRSRWRS